MYFPVALSFELCSSSYWTMGVEPMTYRTKVYDRNILCDFYGASCRTRIGVNHLGRVAHNFSAKLAFKMVSDVGFEPTLFFVPNEVPYQTWRIGVKLEPSRRFELRNPDYKSGVLPLELQGQWLLGPDSNRQLGIPWRVNSPLHYLSAHPTLKMCLL